MTTLALEELFDSVVQRFNDEGTLFTNHFGWREPPRQLRQKDRIVWVPGDPAGNAGEVLGPRHPGQLPARPLGTLDELYHVLISSRDSADPEDERQQYRTCRLAFDAWYRAVYLRVRGVFSIKSIAWDRTKTERQFGATLIVVGAIQSILPDANQATAPTDAVANVTPTMLDQTDPVMVIPPNP